MHVRACAHLMCRCGCKYVCVHMCMCICMRACMHLHMVHKCAKVISLTPRCGGDPIRARKWSRCGLLCVRFLFGIEQEANRRKLLRCASFAREPEMAGAFACARKHLLCTCMCVRICVSIFGVCMDVCKLACACACEHACNKGCSIRSVSLMSIIAGHISEVLMATRSTQQKHSSKTTSTQQQQHHQVCVQ